MAASNIRIQFLFAGDCINCTNYKAGGNFEAIKNELEQAGFIVGVTEVKRMRESESYIKSKAILKLASWYPQIFIIAEDLFNRIDEFPVDDVLQAISLPNGSIVESSKGFTARMPPSGQLKLSASYLKEQAKKYETSPAYAKAKSLTSSSRSPPPSVVRDPQPDDDLIRGGFFFPTAQVTSPPTSAPAPGPVKEVSGGCMKMPRQHQRYR